MKLDVAAAKDAGFKDVSGWATNYVNACANAGYVKGKAEGEFAPSANITRAELATLFNNITGAKAGTSCSYADVDANAWYFGYVAAAAK
jgi:endo-1,4-beta-xylanase